MPLDVLNRYDNSTASAILAAAALSTSSMPFEAEDDLIVEHRDQVSELLTQIRRRLNLRSDDSSIDAKTSIDAFISKSIDEVVMTAPAAEAALSRAGQAGRLSPALYKVEQPAPFCERFYALTFKKHIVQEVINTPDEFQHLLNDGAAADDRDNLSLFLKKFPEKKRGSAHWLLVQTVRSGFTQVANSAWRVFPTDVDLMKAGSPVDVLRQFAAAFGLPVKVGSQVDTFVESQTVIKDAPVNIEYGGPLNHEIFMSYSLRGKTVNPLISKVGVAYCIDLVRYKAALKNHGFNV